MLIPMRAPPGHSCRKLLAVCEAELNSGDSSR